jgi:hypothetical protein
LRNKLILVLIFQFINLFRQHSALAAGQDTTNSQPPTQINSSNTIPIPSITPPVTSQFSSSFSGTTYGSSNCGVQVYLNGGYLEGSQGISNGSNILNSPSNNLGVQVGIVFNTNPCTDNKELETLRQKFETERQRLATQAQKDVACIQVRGEFAKLRPELIPSLDSICKISGLTF